MFDVSAIRDAARWAAEQRLLDVCEATVAGEGPSIRNPETGKVEPPPRVPIYGPDIAPHYGACRVRMATAASSVIQGPDGQVALTLSAIIVPSDVVFRKGVDVTVLESDNPAAVNLTRTIRSLHTGSQQTTNRYGFEELN